MEPGLFTRIPHAKPRRCWGGRCPAFWKIFGRKAMRHPLCQGHPTKSSPSGAQPLTCTWHTDWRWATLPPRWDCGTRVSRWQRKACSNSAETAFVAALPIVQWIRRQEVGQKENKNHTRDVGSTPSSSNFPYQATSSMSCADGLTATSRRSLAISKRCPSMTSRNVSTSIHKHRGHVWCRRTSSNVSTSYPRVLQQSKSPDKDIGKFSTGRSGSVNLSLRMATEDASCMCMQHAVRCDRCSERASRNTCQPTKKPPKKTPPPPLQKCERIVFRHGVILLIVRGLTPGGGRHGSWCSGQSTGRLWKRKSRSERETGERQTRRDNKRTLKHVTSWMACGRSDCAPETPWATMWVWSHVQSGVPVYTPVGYSGSPSTVNETNWNKKNSDQL